MRGNDVIKNWSRSDSLQKLPCLTSKANKHNIRSVCDLLFYIPHRTDRNKASMFSNIYEGVSRSFRTGRLERELQMVQLSATRCSCIAILCVSLVSFATITFCVASQRVFVVVIVVVVYFVVDSVRKLSDTPSYLTITFRIKRSYISYNHICILCLDPVCVPFIKYVHKMNA
jgi:hypothetical protein